MNPSFNQTTSSPRPQPSPIFQNEPPHRFLPPRIPQTPWPGRIAAFSAKPPADYPAAHRRPPDLHRPMDRIDQSLPQIAHRRPLRLRRRRPRRPSHRRRQIRLLHLARRSPHDRASSARSRRRHSSPRPLRPLPPSKSPNAANPGAKPMPTSPRPSTSAAITPSQMRKLLPRRRADIPGETNQWLYESRGPAVIIAPWNFPLAILCGMAAAAVVAGNPVILKPAEQSPLIACRLARAFEEAGAPAGVVNYLPGIGEEIGPILVAHPDVALIAFTGSRAVGLSINHLAAKPRGPSASRQTRHRRNGRQKRHHRRRRCRPRRRRQRRRRQRLRIFRPEMLRLLARDHPCPASTMRSSAG